MLTKSLSCGILPSEWKLANISPIPKRNPIHDVTNYRPISLLSLVSKVFERCIYNRLIEHVYGQIYELQYGFLRDRSTTSQLLHILHQVLNVLEQKKQVDIVYLDFAKAFDKVNHDLLLVKLHNSSSLVQRLPFWAIPESHCAWCYIKTTSSSIRCSPGINSWATSIHNLHQ